MIDLPSPGDLGFGEDGSVLLPGINGRGSWPKVNFFKPLSHTPDPWGLNFPPSLGFELNKGCPGHTPQQLS